MSNWKVLIFKWQTDYVYKWDEFRAWIQNYPTDIVEVGMLDDSSYSKNVYVTYKVKEERLISWMILKYNCVIKSHDYYDWLKMKKAIDESSYYTIDWKKNG